jgi:DNA-binding CsgD family transcriptional regulator
MAYVNVPLAIPLSALGPVDPLGPSGCLSALSWAALPKEQRYWSRKMRRVNDSILSIYRLARNSDQEEFQAQAFQILFRYVQFDRARWRVGLSAADGLVIRTLGRLTSQLFSRPGVAGRSDNGNVVTERADRVAPVCDAVAIKKATRSCSVIYAESFVDTPETLGAWQWPADFRSVSDNAARPAQPVYPLVLALSIYRDTRDRNFSEEERKVTQLLHKHISEAWSINLCVALQRHQQRLGDNQSAGAIATYDGTMLFGELGFMRSLEQEWPHVQGAVLPIPLLLSLGAGESFFQGKTHVFQFEREAATVYVRARPKLAVDSLSIRELQVARHIAAGLTYKEIARALGVAPGTVRKQIVSVHERMGVRNNAELAARLGAMLPWLQALEPHGATAAAGMRSLGGSI